MNVSALARLILRGFIAVFAVATAYLLLDAIGIWPRLPETLTRGVELLTGLVLLATLLGHLALATGALPPDSIGRSRR